MNTAHAQHSTAGIGMEEHACPFCGNVQRVAVGELDEARCKVCLAAMIPDEGPVQDPAWMIYAPVPKAANSR